MFFLNDEKLKDIVEDYNTNQHHEESKEFFIRKEKVTQLKTYNVPAFPEKFEPIKHFSSTVISEFTENSETEYVIAGRILAIRKHGKTCFATIQDIMGKIQIYLKKTVISENLFSLFDECIDIGDIIRVSGTTFKTKMGEITILVSDFTLLSKCMLPLPEKFHGLVDTETKYRQRYLDLITNEQSRERFKKRSQVIHAMRTVFEKNGYIEVETPMLHPIPGGALAKPFKTHHNALNMELYLRIAPELYLKRLVIGGFDRVYEINRNFRNEGISTRHNPEFTMVEFYTAYANYETIMTFTEELIRTITMNVCNQKIVIFNEHELNFNEPFKRITMIDSVSEKIGFSKADLLKKDVLITIANKHHIKNTPDMSWGSYLALLFEHFVEKTLIQPTFVTQFPTDISPLSKKNPTDPLFTDRFELFVAGIELSNGFNELNDPFDQEQRFKDQLAGYDEHDEAHAFDADYIKALQYALPPTAGVGIGIDRLVMFLTNAKTIRDVILFPTLRHK